MKHTIRRTRRYFSSMHWLFGQSGLLLWAIVMGIAGAFSTIAFNEVVAWIQRLHSGADGDMVAIAWEWSTWQSILIPTIGGLIGGILLFCASKLRVDTNSDYMEAVAIGDGRLSLRQGLLRVASSLGVVSTGGSLGREGPIIHLAAMIASFFGRLFLFDLNRLRLLVACGAAAGVAAAYHAPIAGALFIAEIVLGSMAMHVIGPLLLASATSFITMHAMGFGETLYHPPAMPFLAHVYWLVIVLIGAAAGVLAPLFLRYLAFCRRVFDAIGLHMILKLCLGGFLLGCVLVYEPWVAGRGDTVIRSFFANEWTWQAVLIVFALKLLATGISVGSGAIGGVITPVMFVGAGLIMLCVQLASLVYPEVLQYGPLFILVAMGAFLAAASSAPLMAVMLIIEMTYNFTIVPPLIVACVFAYFISKAMTGTVMFEVVENRDKNDAIRRELSKLRINSLVHPVQITLTTENTVRDALNIFLEHSLRFIYIVNENKEYLGVVAHKDVTSLLLIRQELDEPISKELIQRTYVDPLKLNMSLDEVQDHFVNFNGERLPVVDLEDPPHLIGVVYKSDVLRKYSEIKRIEDQRGESIVDIRGSRPKIKRGVKK